ncbi:1,2-phenylacetyl-CoA epoxidase, subunit A [Candidatus Entotheonellaceae bacterium PAL068K]
MSTATAREQDMMAKIEAGLPLEKPQEMTEEYRQHLVHLMLMQADSELSGGYGYVPWIMKAPSVEEKLIVANIVKDEIRHAKAMYGLLAELGFDVQAHIEAQNLAFRLDEGAPDIGTERLATDQRVNIFYYPIDTWTDFVMFNFCMDRGAGHQLEDVLTCSYGPWRRVVQGIFKEEVVHIAHGETWVRRLAGDPTTHDECQDTLNKWYVRTMHIFGRSASSRNVLYRKLGLKRRDNGEVRQAFHHEVKTFCDHVGLTLPEWTPEQSA